MRLASKEHNSFRSVQAFRLFRLWKRIRQWIRYRRGMPKTVVYVVGCQRSGTSMFHHLLRRDLDSVTYDEESPLSTDDLKQGLRLNDLESVRSRIEADRSPLVALKPLVESQNLQELLALFPETRAVWMYRHYADVAASNVTYFGDATGRGDLAAILSEDPTDWRAEHVDPGIRDILHEFHGPDLPAHDAAALFWFARNSLFFTRGYDTDPRIRTCRYSDLIEHPGSVMAEVYGFLGRPYPGDRIVNEVFATSRGKGRDLALAPRVRDLCEDLLGRLDETNRIRG